MLNEALSFWEAISGKVKQLIRGETKNVFRTERYEVTTAPDGTKIGVTLPFGTNEIFLPYSSELASATVGESVLVVWWGSMSNAKAYYYADGYRGQTVYSVNGKVGTVSLNPTDVGAMSEWDLLWTNSAPTTSFSPQTVEIDLSGYAAIGIYFYNYSSTDPEYGAQMVIGLVGDKICLPLTSYTGRGGVRIATTSTSGIAFGDGLYNNTTQNGYAIPYKIYGINGTGT